MKKTMKFLSMAALALVGAVMTGCSSDEDGFTDTPQQPVVTNYSVTKTLRVSLDGGEAGARGITRALTSGGEKTFSAGDKLAVIYMNEGGTMTKVETEELKAGNISGDGKTATFTVTLTEPPLAGKIPLTYIYPASIATSDGYVDNSQLSSQDGTLASLASNLDACRGYDPEWGSSGDLPTLTLTNAFTIGKFIIKNPSGTAINDELTSVTISDGANTYTITPTGSTFTSDPIWVAMQPVTTGDITIYAAKGKELYKKTVSGKALDAGKLYPINVTTTKVEGALSGQFTVNSSGKKVYFSQGNLQAVIADGGPTNTYNYAASSWQFAEHQWDFIGNAAGNTSFAAGSTVDLFGWVGYTAAYDTYGLCTFVTNNNNQVTSDSYFGSHSASETLRNDWGTLAISNGGNTANSGWRTLTRSEWDYLFNTRSGATVKGTSNVRYTLATINTNNGSGGVRGAILFPDGVTIANGEATSWGALNSVSQWNDATKCTTTQWTALAAKGCVFLPITGYRSGTTVEQATYVGHYWSSTPANNEETKAISLMFSNQLLLLSNIGDFRCNGHAVRLVKDVE